MDNLLEYYVKEYSTENFSACRQPPASQFFHGLRMKMDEDMGRGWSEMLSIHNGLYVTMADYRLSRKIETCHRDMQSPFHLGIQLSGHFESRTSDGANHTIAPGDIWFVYGSFEQVFFTHFPNENICGVSIGLPHDLVEFWLGSCCCKASRGLEKLAYGNSGHSARPSEQQSFPLIRGLQHSSGFMRIARELIDTKRQTLADNLRFESLALDFLSRILTLEDFSADSCLERTRKTRAAVDEAVDILRCEWNDPPNISTLARRIGVNETYLKEWFRQQTGMTIGEYIREQRMKKKKALEMIETGRYSILDTALFVGYSNPSYFSAAFKKFYGHLPSYYLPKGGRI